MTPLFPPNTTDDVMMDRNEYNIHMHPCRKNMSNICTNLKISSYSQPVRIRVRAEVKMLALMY